MAKAITKAWTKSDGEVRRYVNNLNEIMGVIIDRYRTGNVRSATFRGEGISNAEANRFLNVRAYVDENGAVQVYTRGSEPRFASLNEIRDEVIASL